MSTYRERRQARAERLREWAEKREQKAEAAHAAADAISEGIPFGQPILVGHHSEGRHRRDLERMHRQHEAGWEHAAKARSMANRAENIKSQLSGAIYSDDPDAVEQLRARVATLEAERDRIKAYNASCRKGARDLSLLDERQQRTLLRGAQVGSVRENGAFPAYHLTNLSGNIARQRKRLEALERKAS